MGYTRDELATLGRSFPTERLLGWSEMLLEEAGKVRDLLRPRGISDDFLADLAGRVARLRALVRRASAGPVDPPEPADWRPVQKAARRWLFEVRRMAEIEFGAEPDLLARFRTGVKVSSSIPKLADEIRSVLPTLREHRPQLAWLGMDDQFVEQGEKHAAALGDVQSRLSEYYGSLPEARIEVESEKGALYEMGRKLLRIGRMAFAGDPNPPFGTGYGPLRDAAPKSRAPARRGARATAN